MKNNTFFDTFAGEVVEILTDLQVPSHLNVDEEGRPSAFAMPLVVNGYFMDMDANFVYLSIDGESVNQAIPVKDIKHIQIVDVKSLVEEMADNIPDPEDGSHFN